MRELTHEEYISFYTRQLLERAQHIQPSLGCKDVQRIDMGDQTMVLIPMIMGRSTVDISINRDMETLYHDRDRSGEIKIRGYIISDPHVSVTINADWAIYLILSDGTIAEHVDCKRAFLYRWASEEVSNEQDQRCTV